MFTKEQLESIAEKLPLSIKTLTILTKAVLNRKATFGLS